MGVKVVKVTQRRHGNLMDSIDPQPLKGFQQKLTQVLTIIGRRTVYLYKIMGSKVKVIGTFAGEGIQIDDSPSKIILFISPVMLSRTQELTQRQINELQIISSEKQFVLNIYTNRVILFLV